MKNKCRYKRAYSLTNCNQEADKSGFCKEHKGKKCCVCGEQATHECNYTGQFVCGYPLCDNCTEGKAGDSNKGLGWGFIGHTHIRKQGDIK
jgi:hypothetical protein